MRTHPNFDLYKYLINQFPSLFLSFAYTDSYLFLSLFTYFDTYKIMKLYILLVVLFCYSGLAAYCNGRPGPYYVNNEPIWKQQPRLIKTHKFGKLFQIGTGTTTMKLLHVYGNMYQMGFAHGHLLKDQLQSFIHELWDYIQQQIQEGLPKKIPSFLRKGTSNFAAGAALDLTYQVTRPFTKKDYYEEMKGISDASGVPYKYFRRIHMIGQLTKGACSMFGAWGKATSKGQTVQLRALDWDFDGPYKKYAMAIVYHPSSPKYGNTWMNIGFTGWVGILSGVNEHRMGVSEIGVSYPDETFQKQSRVGNPFTFVLRDILQFDKNIDEAIKTMKTTKRTCNLILGVGDGNAGYFRGFQVSHSVCNVVDDTHPLPSNDTWHAPVENAVYWGMDWMCPNFHIRLHQMLTKYHGNISAETTIRYILPGLNSGNLQAVIYDLSYDWVYFAYGYEYFDQKGGRVRVDAYKRPFIGLNLKEVFALKNEN